MAKAGPKATAKADGRDAPAIPAPVTAEEVAGWFKVAIEASRKQKGATAANNKRRPWPTAEHVVSLVVFLNDMQHWIQTVARISADPVPFLEPVKCMELASPHLSDAVPHLSDAVNILNQQVSYRKQYFKNDDYEDEDTESNKKLVTEITVIISSIASLLEQFPLPKPRVGRPKKFVAWRHTAGRLAPDVREVLLNAGWHNADMTGPIVTDVVSKIIHRLGGRWVKPHTIARVLRAKRELIPRRRQTTPEKIRRA